MKKLTEDWLLKAKADYYTAEREIKVQIVYLIINCSLVREKLLG
jgi:hypothetical protein